MADFGTVRVRTTAGAVLVVGLAMLAGSLALLVFLHGALTRQVRTAAGLRAAELAAQLPPGRPTEIAVADEDAQLVQVLDRDGTVVAASANLAGSPPLARLRPGESAEVGGPDGDDRYLAVAAATPDGAATVVVAGALDDVTESTELVGGLLAAGVPLLLLVVAFTTWKVVGRALAPVDAIGREVEEISAARLHRRVPVPPGGDEISRLAGTMNGMLARLEDAQRQQRQFVSDASHELRSPVASIRQHAEVAAAHPQRSTVGELADTVLADALRLQHLVSDLLLLAAADERAPPGEAGPVDLDDVVFEQAARLRGRPGLTVDTTAVSGGRVRGDPATLHRLVANLAENAARHAHSRVALGLRERGGAVVLRVDDDGPGIPTADRQRIFQRFVRLDRARATGLGGSGLGLAIVAEAAAASGATVTVADAPIGGARVEVRFPQLVD